MNKFDKLYNSIKNRLSLILEDFSNDDFLLKFDFKKDENDNIICTFSTKNNDDKSNLIVIGKYFKGEISFITTDTFGNSINYSEKEFATKYYNVYNKFKKELKNFLENEDNLNNNDLGNIESFNEKLDNETDNDVTIKVEKTYEIDGMNFVFRLLNDLAVENYCECIFDFQDNKTKNIYYVRSLLNILNKNSLIIKLLFFNNNGELINRQTKTIFSKNYPDIYKKLELAINKFEKYVKEIKNDFN